MKFNIMAALAPAALVVTLAVSAAAAPMPFCPPNARDPHNINERLHNQQERIHQGVESGSLTRREQYRLQEREAQIRYQEDRDRLTGGRFTPYERRRIEQEENRASRDIYRQKHDAQYR